MVPGVFRGEWRETVWHRDFSFVKAGFLGQNTLVKESLVRL
jgi:hypothetical protein